MWWLAEVRVDAGLLARLQRLVVFFSILIPASAHANEEVVQAPDYELAQIRLTPANSTTPIAFSVKLAVTPTQHAFGLMFSPPLPAKSGMLFVFEDMKPRTFWMKNTPIALDMLFFDDKGQLVNAIENVPPQTLESRRSAAPARYVLELKGGSVARHGIKSAARLLLPAGLQPD